MFPSRASDPGGGNDYLSPFNLSIKARVLSKSLGIDPFFGTPEKQWRELNKSKNGVTSNQYGFDIVETETHVRFLVNTFERCREDEIVKSWGRHRTEMSLDFLLNTLQERRQNQTHDEKNLYRRVLRLLLRFTREVDLYPPSLFIAGIKMGKFASFGGGFADVHKGDWNGSAVAIKRLRVYSDDPQEKRQQMKKTLFREALIWCTMKHRNILPLVGVCVSDALSPFLMVSPWMENGNIVRYTTIHKTSQQVIDAMLREVAAGLEYLHAHGLVHGDVRGVRPPSKLLSRRAHLMSLQANVLVDQYMHPRIADFGLAHLSDMAHSNSGSGSARWMAPELHDPQAFGLEHPVRTRQSDFFAFGMLCLEVSSGQLPFSHLRTDGAALLAIVRGERPKRPLEENRRMSDVLWTWASCCWSHRPGDRPSMKELLEDSVHDIETRTSSPVAGSRSRYPSRFAFPAAPYRKQSLEKGLQSNRISMPPPSRLLVASGQTGSLHEMLKGCDLSHNAVKRPPIEATRKSDQSDFSTVHAYPDLAWDLDLSESVPESSPPMLPFVRVYSCRTGSSPRRNA